MNYTVWKAGEKLTTHSCTVYPRPYHVNRQMEYVMFAIAQPIQLMIESQVDIERAVVRPLSANIPFELKEGKLLLTLNRPCKLSVEINGSSDNNLMVFAHREEVKPVLNDRCIVLRAGEEYTGTLTVDQNHTTVYLEEGAVLQGNLRAENCEDITICGFGRICMERYSYEMRKDFARSVDIIGCRNVTIRDIIIDDSNDWSMRLNGCDNVTVENVKIFGCRGNSDGIDVCGSRNVTVSDIFTRVWDDSFVVKALDTGNAENIVFKDSVLWNDFARPMEVGVELRANGVKNIRFENIDILHSTTGYPLMGIHHGDRARVSNIVFDNIRIEDAPGAQLFDMRIAHSVWNRDNAMGDIRDITFSNITYIGTDDDGILLSNSRVEGFDAAHDIRGVRFHNISIKGRAAITARQLGLDIHEFAGDVSVTSDLPLPEAAILTTNIALKELLQCGADGLYRGSIAVRLANETAERVSGRARLAVSPKHMEEEQDFLYDLRPGEQKEFIFTVTVQPGKYVFYLKDDQHMLQNEWLYLELNAVLPAGRKAEENPLYRLVNYEGTNSVGVRLAVADDCLTLLPELKNQHSVRAVLYTAMPAVPEEGEVLFSAEETDFGEVCAVLKKGDGVVAAPQLRCPAEITYVFRNEPKVKEIRRTELTLTSGQPITLSFDKLGIASGAEQLWLELAAETEETVGLRYPYTLFHSTSPDKTAHMFGRITIRKEEPTC